MYTINFILFTTYFYFYIMQDVFQGGFYEKSSFFVSRCPIGLFT